MDDDNADLKAKRYKLTLDPNFQPEQISDKTFKRWKNAFKTTLEGKSAVGPSHEHKELVEKPEPSNLNSDGLMLCENNFLENDNLSIEEVFCSSSDDHDDDDDDIDFPERNSQHEEQQLPDQKPSDCKTTFIEDGDKIMFKQSGITVKEVVEMVVAYNLRFGDSQEARQMLIEMIKIFAGPEFSNFNISNYSLSKIFDPPSEKIIYHFYCQKCTDKVLYKSCKKGIKGKKVLCETCKMEYTLTLSNPNYFVGIDLEYQLQMFLENEETAKYFIPKNTDCNSSKGNKNFMRDIDDSILHKSAIEKYAATITYLISTDGAPLFHISKRGFWPLQIILNNLPVHLRFKFVLLVGLMIVKNEPKPNLMNLFINAFIEQANHLHSKGMKVKIAHLDSEIEIHFTPSGAVADSVARPILQNRLQFNGYFGCSFCYQRGVFIFKIGLRYPFVSEEPELRSHTSHMKDIACAKEQGSFFQGVKGESAFIDLANIDMVWSFSLDYMHNAVLGVTEQIWKKWIKELTAEQRREIDELLLLQKPPRDLHRSTEKISSKSIWKATHWRSWLLYFSVPICSLYLKKIELLEHYILFVNSMFVLLETEISYDKLDKCEQDLMTFVALYENLYGVESMTFNIHVLLHFVSSIKKSGPPWATSAFPFEHNIYFLKQTISGPKSVEQQMSVKSLNLLKYRLRLPNNDIFEKASNYCKTIFSSKIVSKNAVKVNDVTFYGPDPTNIFESVTEKHFERCFFNNCIFSSTIYSRSRKFNDTVVELKNGDFAQITGIYLLPDGTCSFHVNKLIVEQFLVGSKQVSHMLVIKRNVKIAPVSTSYIKSKAVVINLKDRQLIAKICNTIEAQ